MPKIAIIDSGVSKSVCFKENVCGGIRFAIIGSSIFMSDDYEDINGHGTMCASIINKYNPEAKLYIIRIMDDKPTCSSFLLLQALEYLFNKDVEYINLSLSVDRVENVAEIEQALERLSSQGKKIVSSVKNGKECSYPANSINCIGVNGKELRNKYIRQDVNGIEYIADNTPELAESINERLRWFGGNSKAAAMMTGILSRKSNVDYLYFNEECISDERYTSELYTEISEIIYRYVDDFGDSDCLWVKKEFVVRNIYELIKELERRYDIIIDYNEVDYMSFYDINSLCRFVTRKRRTTNGSNC